MWCDNCESVFRSLTAMRSYLGGFVNSSSSASLVSCPKISRQQFEGIMSELIDWHSPLPDAADKLLAQICRMNDAPAEATNLREGDLFYMPTQVRQIEETLHEGYLNKNSIFVDVGCGPGARLPVYVQLRTGARTAGIEKYDLYYQHAKETVQKLCLNDRIEIFHCDALDYNYRYGNVFYFFQPVEGEKLDLLLDKLVWQRRGEEALIIANGNLHRAMERHPGMEWLREFAGSKFQMFKTVS